MITSTMAVRYVMTRGARLLVPLWIAVTLPQEAGAATKTFDGGVSGTGSTMDGATNWVGDVLPVTGDEVLLDNSVITLPATLTTVTTATFGNLIVNSTTLTNISLTGASSRIINLSGGGGSTVAIAAGGATGDLLLLGSNVYGTVNIGGGSGAGKLNMALLLDGGNFDVVNSDATLVVSGALSGALSLNKTGLGTLTLSGANSFGGAGSRFFELKTGTVNINSATALGSGGATFRIDDGTTIDNTSGGAITQANNQPVIINGSFTFTGGSGTTHDLNLGTGNVNLGSGTRTITTGAGNLTLGGAISGSGSLIKAGAGTLTLSTTNTFSGATTINNGRIVIGSSLALQNIAYDTTGSTGAIGLDVTGFTTLTLGGLAGNVDLATAITGFSSITALTLNSQTNVTSTYSGVIANGSGSMPLIKTGAGTQVLAGTNTYSGNTTISAGVLSIASTDSLPGWDTNGRYAVSSNATVAVGDAVTDGNIATLLGTTNFAAGARIGFDTTAGDRTYDFNIVDTPNGALGLVKVGTNALVLTGAKTYTGGTTVGAGTLQLGDGIVNGSIGGASIVNNATVVYKLNGSDMTVSNVISGTGTFIKSGAGKLTVSTVQTYTGPTTINGGVLNFTAGPAGTVFNINGTSELDLNIFNVSFMSKSFVFDSTGGGTISANMPRANGGTITTSGGARDSLIGSWKVETAGFTFNVARGSDPTCDLLVSAVVSFNGPLVKTGAGILTLSGANVFSSGVQLQQGGLVLGNAVALGTSAGTFTISNGTTLDGSNIRITNTNPEIWGGDFTYSGKSGTLDLGTGTVDLGSVPHTVTVADKTLTVGGIISGTGSLTKAGPGILTLSGTNTYSGATVVSNGVLRLTQSQCLGTNAVVYLYSGATNDLAFTGALAIDSLYIDGVLVAAGTWGSASSPAAHQNSSYFSGTGVLAPVNGDLSSQGTLLMVK